MTDEPTTKKNHNSAKVTIIRSHHPEYLWKVGYCFVCKTLFFECPDCGKTVNFKVPRKLIKQWMPELREHLQEQHPNLAYTPEKVATKKPKQKDLV